MVGLFGTIIKIFEEGQRAITIHGSKKISREEKRDRFRFNSRDRIKISFDRSPGKGTKRRLSTKHSRRPVSLRIPPSQGFKARPANLFWYVSPAPVLYHVVVISSVASEVFISSIARKSHRHVATRRLRNIIGRNSR